MEPQVQYCTTSDGVSIAYSVTGDGPPLVYLQANEANHLVLDGRRALSRGNYEWLARRCTLVRFDQRGMGLSQRKGFEFSEILDIEAVTRKLALPQFAIFAIGGGARRAIAYAVAHPEQVTRLVLWNGFASRTAFASDPRIAGLLGLAENDWTMYTETYAAVIGGWEDAAEARAAAAVMRESITQDGLRRWNAAATGTDVTALLPSITAPTLVVHVRESIVPIDAIRTLVAGIPDARMQSIDGKSVFVPYDAPTVAPWLEAFLSGEEAREPIVDAVAPPAARRGVTTILFTDIVGHTEMMQRLGDVKGRDVLREHERITRETLKAHGGAEVKTMGDGFMASFGSVTQAMECAIALQRAFAAHTEKEAEPLHVRVGLNAGEPIEEDGDLFGATVILASRIAAKAEGGEILIPEPVRHLLSGKAFTFSDRGEFAMKGFDDAVHLYEVRWQD